jgi:hypothetical protein
MGTANVGSRAPACPPFIVALRERGATAIHGKRPRSGRGSDRFPDPDITFQTVVSFSRTRENQFEFRQKKDLHMFLNVFNSSGTRL